MKSLCNNNVHLDIYKIILWKLLLIIINIKNLEEDDLQPWNLDQLVSNFKKMNENRLAYIRTGYLKPDKFEFYKKVTF